MSDATVARAGVAGIGIALPERAVPNEPIAVRIEVEPEWIVTRTGIRERRIAGPGETVVSLAAAAGARALADAGRSAADVDLLLVASTRGDDLMPGSAALVAGALGASRAGAIDVNAACTGFVAGLSLAAGALDSGRAGTVLLIGAEVLSRMTDPDDRRTAALFGDGAGAIVLDDGAAVGPVILGSEAAPELLRTSHARGLIEMEGQEVFRHAVARMSEATVAACAAADVAIEEIDHFVYHQANRRILDAIGRRLRLDPERVVETIGRYGNTSSASIPMALADVAPRPGARVLVAAFGAGFTWGGAVVTW